MLIPAARCWPLNAHAGVFSRQLVLGENLDTDRIDATYHGGVLTLRIPVAERAKPVRSRSAAAMIMRSSTRDRPVNEGAGGHCCRLHTSVAPATNDIIGGR
jgi:hypothetical protein